VLATHSPALTVTAAYVAGTVLLVAFATLTAPVFPRPIFSSVRAWVVVFYHAILGAVAHTWWYRGVELVGASRAAVFMNVTPIVGVVLAGTLLDERIGVWEVLGTMLVLGGVALTVWKGGAGRLPLQPPIRARHDTRTASRVAEWVDVTHVRL